MNTQGNINYVYLTNGKSLAPQNVFAYLLVIFSHQLLFLRTNEVLVWFLFNKKK
ncbi:hypothetical protein [Polaribacter sp. IC073]|uniref:hypothetical protein n=1 Tax=Polaribacter sp. IC073 TaxID=2508540 RepID=UPI0016745E98|nr:hypothetical protein [Polaribacter sp. IC073]